MKKLARITVIILFALMAVGVITLSGCADSGVSETPSTEPSVTTVSVTTADTTAEVTTAEVTTAADATAADTTAPDTTAAVTTVAVTTTSVTTAPVTEEEDEWVSAIFGGGPIVSKISAMAPKLKTSGFNTVIIWSVHVQNNGDLHLNDIPVCKNGEFIGKSAWVTAWHSLKQGTTSVKRVEISVGAWGCTDFENIKNFIAKDGTGEDTMLYKNFKALMDATGADAVNFDDESCYDVTSAVKFAKMCVNMGMKVALCPYTNIDFWKNVKNSLGDSVDRVYLQCYAGGSGNDPQMWKKTLNTEIIPGYWCLHNNGSEGMTAEQVSAAMKKKQTSITGGFMWLFDDMINLSSPNATKNYAAAINGVKPEN